MPGLIVALEDVFGDKENTNQLFRQFFYWKQVPSELIASYSHGLIDIADCLQRLEPKSSVERDVMLHDQSATNVRDIHLHWDMKSMDGCDDYRKFIMVGWYYQSMSAIGVLFQLRN